jgi:SAM-dependent methyltransferase
VVNVGAGTGAYEPADLDVVAVEPSETMIAQRAEGAAPIVRAVAEELPFEDGAFDAAMAVLSDHHWSDRSRGIAEMKRVARRVVTFTWDPATIHDTTAPTASFTPTGAARTPTSIRRGAPASPRSPSWSRGAWRRGWRGWRPTSSRASGSAATALCSRWRSPTGATGC